MKTALKTICLLLIVCTFFSCNEDESTNTQTVTEEDDTKGSSWKRELYNFRKERQQTKKRIELFDQLDFDHYNNQDWDAFSISHADDIIVHNADGSITHGLDAHTNSLKPAFDLVPDLKITGHPVKFGNGDWTAVIGRMEGTNPSNGKKLNLLMATIAKWEGLKMVEEYLFWDNKAFAEQLGLNDTDAAILREDMAIHAISKTTKSPWTEYLQFKKEEQINNERLRIFDELDFEHYTNQNWEGFRISHADDIKVYYPNGFSEVGLDPHVNLLKPEFEYLPDTRIQEHPVRIASGDWTAVIGIQEATFTKPLTLDDGTVIPPNGNKLKYTMVTFGRWENGKMVEEYLFWDNQTYDNQLGL